LIYKTILIGNSANIVAQAEELNGFIKEQLRGADISGGTIAFYSKNEIKNELMRLVPTESVKLVRVARYQPDNILAALQTVEQAEKTHLYLFPSGAAGSELAVRWAYRKKGSSLVQVKQIEYSETQFIAKKTVYANHALGGFRLSQKPYCISLAKGAVSRYAISTRKELIVTEHDLTDLQTDRYIKYSEWIPTEPAPDLEDAAFIIIGGRGMHNKDNTRNLEKMADAMGADFGVSRPVALSAWAPMHRMIGVSGAMIQPEVCITAGVSGAAAFYAGIEKSKTIIAINMDARAPIMKAADVAVTDDYQAVMAVLTRIVQN
jgi:electron transfer flavoprotein alpha subunit